MPPPIGHTRWAILEGYVPGGSTGPEPTMTSHETFCVLNAGDADAHLVVTLYFADREPVGPYRVTVVIQHTRLDSRQAANALLSTVAFPG